MVMEIRGKYREFKNNVWVGDPWVFVNLAKAQGIFDNPGSGFHDSKEEDIGFLPL